MLFAGFLLRAEIAPSLKALALWFTPAPREQTCGNDRGKLLHGLKSARQRSTKARRVRREPSCVPLQVRNATSLGLLYPFAAHEPGQPPRRDTPPAPLPPRG